MKKTIRIFAFSLMIIAFVGSTDLKAQSFKATITGQVTDSTGAVVPNATVTISETATNQSQTVELKAGFVDVRKIVGGGCHF